MHKCKSRSYSHSAWLHNYCTHIILSMLAARGQTLSVALSLLLLDFQSALWFRWLVEVKSTSVDLPWHTHMFARMHRHLNIRWNLDTLATVLFFPCREVIPTWRLTSWPHPHFLSSQRGVAYKKLNQQISIKHALYRQKWTKQRNGWTIWVPILMICTHCFGLCPFSEVNVICKDCCPLGALWLSVAQSTQVPASRRFQMYY